MKNILTVLALIACGRPALVPTQVAESTLTNPPPSLESQSTLGATVGTDDPLTVRVHVRARHGRAILEVAPNDTLHTNDYVELHVTVNARAYVYVVQLFPQGNASVLFPYSRAVAFAPGIPMRIPPNLNEWYQLDDITGTETVYIVASRDPIAKVDEALDKEIRAIETTSDTTPPTPATMPIASKSYASGSDASNPKPTMRGGTPKRMLTMATRGLHKVVKIDGYSVIDTAVPIKDAAFVVAWFSFHHGL